MSTFAGDIANRGVIVSNNEMGIEVGGFAAGGNVVIGTFDGSIINDAGATITAAKDSIVAGHGKD